MFFPFGTLKFSGSEIRCRPSGETSCTSANSTTGPSTTLPPPKTSGRGESTALRATNLAFAGSFFLARVLVYGLGLWHLWATREPLLALERHVARPLLVSSEKQTAAADAGVSGVFAGATVYAFLSRATWRVPVEPAALKFWLANTPLGGASTRASFPTFLTLQPTLKRGMLATAEGRLHTEADKACLRAERLQQSLDKERAFTASLQKQLRASALV